MGFIIYSDYFNKFNGVFLLFFSFIFKFFFGQWGLKPPLVTSCIRPWMKLEKLKGNFSRPSRATLVPIVTLIKILSLQITKKPVLSLKRVGLSGAEGALFDPVTCAAGLLGDQYLPKRKVVMSIKDFGVGDGTTSTTEAFRKAVRYVQGFGDKGGTQLNVPEGLWLTGSFNLTSNFTLFLQKGAVILGSQVLK